MEELMLTELHSISAQDWPELKRYQKQNGKLLQAPFPKNRVVFMGDSITDFWINFSREFFEKNNFVDRGISGQTSPQMLIRFKADVVDLKPAAVVIECGTNDIASNTGPSTLKMVMDNISSMAEIAKAHNIKVIIGSVLPANQFPWKPDVLPSDRIDFLNLRLKQYAQENHFVYLDYYSAMVDDQKGMKKEYAEDGVHPNKAGYTVMEQIAEPAIKKLLGVE